MTYAVRPFAAEDATAVSELFHAAVHRTAAAHYSPEQLAAWSPAPPDPARFVARAADGRLALVAADGGGRAVAYADLERSGERAGHVDLLYCHPDHGGRGLASRLLDALEAAARDWGVALLFAEASEAARPVFERRGWAVEGRRDFELRGVPIHNWRVTLRP